MVAIAGPVGAADLDPAHAGAECGEGEFLDMHFLNNQIPKGAEMGWLELELETLDGTPVGGGQIGAYKVRNKVQHFAIATMLKPGGTRLTGASTDLPGKLLLTRWSCFPDPWAE